MSDTTKKMLSRYVTINVDYNKLEDVFEEFNKAYKKIIEIDKDACVSTGNSSLTIYYKSLETDEDIKRRISNEKSAKESRRLKYLQLKQEFEGV